MYNVQDWRRFRQACGRATVHHQDTGVDLHAVDGLVQQTDAAMRRHPLVKDLNLYYLYPHHMVPNPFMFRPFNDLSIDDIVRTTMSVDSVRLGLHDGRRRRCPQTVRPCHRRQMKLPRDVVDRRITASVRSARASACWTGRARSHVGSAWSMRARTIHWWPRSARAASTCSGMAAILGRPVLSTASTPWASWRCSAATGHCSTD